MSQSELLIKRVIPYPRDVVFDAWTNAEDLVKWYAPRGCKIIVKKLDIREGGKFHWCIKNPNYPDCWCTGQFIRIQVPSFIEYNIRMADRDGNPISSAQAFKQNNWPEETRVAVTFIPHGSNTEIILKQTVIEAVAKQTGAYQGWIEMLEILEEQLSSTSKS